MQGAHFPLNVSLFKNVSSDMFAISLNRGFEKREADDRYFRNVVLYVHKRKKCSLKALFVVSRCGCICR